MKNSNKLTTKRFVIRKSLLGKNTVITFTNKKGDTITYNHDKVYNVNLCKNSDKSLLLILT